MSRYFLKRRLRCWPEKSHFLRILRFLTPPTSPTFHQQRGGRDMFMSPTVNLRPNKRAELKSDREVLAKEEVLNALGTGRHAASLVSLTAALTDTMEMISLAKICDTFPQANTLSHTDTHAYAGVSTHTSRHTSLCQGDETSCTVTELYIMLAARTHTHIHTHAPGTLVYLAESLSSTQSSRATQPSGVTCLDNADCLPARLPRCSHTQTHIVSHTYSSSLPKCLTVRTPLLSSSVLQILIRSVRTQQG